MNIIVFPFICILQDLLGPYYAQSSGDTELPELHMILDPTCKLIEGGKHKTNSYNYNAIMQICTQYSSGKRNDEVCLPQEEKGESEQL